MSDGHAWSGDGGAEAVRLEPPHRTVRVDDPRRRMAGTGAGDPAAATVDDHVAHADELPGTDLAANHLVRGGEEDALRAWVAML